MMKKPVVMMLILLMTLALGGAGLASAQSLSPVQGLIASTTSVYAEPSDAGEPVGELAAGTIVSVLRSNDNQAWYEVEAAEFAGYVPADSVVLLAPSLLAQQAWVASDAAGAAIFAEPDLNSEILSTMTFGDVASILGAQGDQWSVVAGPDGTTGFALTTALEPLAEGSNPAVVTMGATDAAGLYAEANLTGDVAGSVDNGALVYTMGEPDGEWVEVLVPGGESGWMLVDQLVMLPDAIATVSVGSASAGLYVEPDLMADVAGQLENGAMVYVIESVDDFWMNVYAPGAGTGYARKDNFSAPMVMGTVTYNNAVVRQGPNDSIYRAITQLSAGTEVVVAGTSANGEWYQVYVPFDQITYPYNGLSGWINASLVNVDASGLAVTE